MFSTMTGSPRSAAMPCASERPKMSAGPPAGKPITMRTGFAGYVCAQAKMGSSSARILSSLIDPPLLVAAYRHPAVDDDLGAGNEARLVGGEEEHRIRRVSPVAGE